MFLVKTVINKIDYVIIHMDIAQFCFIKLSKKKKVRIYSSIIG
jgi:hypothetical protein